MELNQKQRRVFIFSTHEGAYREVWMDPDGKHYQIARARGAVEDATHPESTFRKKVNWIASAVIDEDYDFALGGPRETV